MTYRLPTCSFDNGILLVPQRAGCSQIGKHGFYAEGHCREKKDDNVLSLNVRKPVKT